MTQEDKNLLLTDLCARLPHGVKIMFSYDGFHWDREQTLEEISRCEDGEYAINGWGIHGIKPYLRPMSSITEEEKLYVELRCGFFYHDGVLDNVHIFETMGTYDRDGNYDPPSKYREQRRITIEQVLDFIHWLNVHHFDYCGLIEKGLALEAPEDMYK